MPLQERRALTVFESSSIRPPLLRLRVLCTTDLHGHVWPFDYQTDLTAPNRGIAPLATLIRAARAEAANSILLDCGDILQGTAMADWASAPEQAGMTHPMIAAMNRLGYDAATLGNHDFNYGLSPLQDAIQAASFPMVCANLVAELGSTADEDIPFAPPWTILTRELTDDTGETHSFRIGVIGTAPPQTVIWDAAVLRGQLAARDAVRAVKAHLPRLRAAGCDIVIALSHAGLGGTSPKEMAEDTSRALAQIDGIDVILTGHSHLRLPGPDFAGLADVDPVAGTIAGKPAAMGGAFGSDLATLDLDLELTAGGWKVAASSVALRSLAATSPDPDILAFTKPAHEATRANMARVVGTARSRLHSVFAMAGPSPALELLAQAQMDRARALVRDTPLDDMPLLSAAAPFKLGGPFGPTGFVDIEAGPLRNRHMVELSPFPNQLCVLVVTGADLRNWLERAVSAYQTVRPGAPDALLLDSAAAAYTLDEIHGLQYQIDLSQPPLFDPRTGQPVPGVNGRGRLAALTCQGRPVGPTDQFAIATSSYRASGGGGFAMIPTTTPRLHSKDSLRDILTDHVRSKGDITATQAQPWSFAPLGQTVLVQTAPHVDLSTHGEGMPQMDNLGLNAEGYRLFRLSL